MQKTDIDRVLEKLDVRVADLEMELMLLRISQMAAKAEQMARWAVVRAVSGENK